MKLEKKIQLKNMEQDRAVVERLVEENLSGKLDSYLNKFDGTDVEGEISLVLEKNKTDRFKGALSVLVDGKTFYYAREDYKSLADLVNHLFGHLKEELANK